MNGPLTGSNVGLCITLHQHKETAMKGEKVRNLKGHCIEFKYYADGIHSGLTPPG